MLVSDFDKIGIGSKFFTIDEYGNMKYYIKETSRTASEIDSDFNNRIYFSKYDAIWVEE